MESVDKREKWTKVVFQSTDAVEVIDTAGDGKQIHGIRKMKSGEQLASDAMIVKNGFVKSAGRTSTLATTPTQTNKTCGYA